jgi:PAS domain S-box-containing protein
MTRYRLKTGKQTSKQAMIDWVIASIVSIVVFVLACVYDVFGAIMMWAQENSRWRVDQLFVVTLILALTFAVLAVRRWRESQAELVRRVEVERDLRDSEARYRKTVDTLSEIIHVVDGDLRVVLANKACQAWNRRRGLESDVVGRDLCGAFPFLGEEARDEYRRVLEEGIELSAVRTFEIDGHEVTSEVRKSPMFEGGQVARVLTVVRDVTAERRAAEETRERAVHLAALNAVIAAAAREGDLQEVLEVALEQTLTALNVTIGAIWFAGKQVVRGLPEGFEAAKTLERYVPEFGTPRTVAVNDWEENGIADARVGPLTAVAHEVDVRSTVCVPVMINERYVGGLAVGGKEPRTWCAGEIALVEAIGGQVGEAAERRRLFQSEREQRELAEALEEAAAAVSGTLELDEVLDRILEQVERVVAGDVFSIMLIEEGAARVVRSRGFDRVADAEREIDRSVSLEEQSYLTPMLDTLYPVVVEDTAADPAWVASPRKGEWQRSYVGAPIVAGKIIVGFLNVSGTRENQFGPRDGERLQAFASHAATALENARLYHKAREHAEELEERVRWRTAEVQAQFARLEAILSGVSDGIIVTDSEGDILETNPVATTWLRQTLSPEDADRLVGTVREIGGRADERPKAVLELSGLDLELTAAPVAEMGAREAAVVVAVHDVSHLKALDRMKTQFVTNVSHELRTPMATVRLYSDLMQRKPEKYLDYVGGLSSETARLEKLVEDIVEVSHIDAGRGGIRLAAIDLNELAEMVISGHQLLADRKGLSLECRPAAGALRALADASRIMQVVEKLLDNAIKYTPSGGKVSLCATPGTADGREWATLVVRDTGVGIPPDELPHMFGRFFRGRRAQAAQESGSGLGLAIAEGIVALHGGRITVESEEDVGSTFTVWLPVA